MATSHDNLESQMISDLEQIRGIMICTRVVADQIIAQQTKSVGAILSLRARRARLIGEQNEARNRRFEDLYGNLAADNAEWEQACEEALGLSFAVVATSELLEKEHQKFRRLQGMVEDCVQTIAEMRGHIEELQAELAENAAPESGRGG